MTDFKIILLTGVTTLFLTAVGCAPQEFSVQTGLENLLDNHLDKLAGKNVGIITNQTGIDRDGRSIWELLQSVKNLNVTALFSPEHGIFGEAADGEKVEYGENKKLPPLFSLYGSTRKPTQDMLEGIDILIYDIQDVGARFYTYITTMGLSMEAAAEAGIPVLILDRPNPLSGEVVSGPILNLGFQTNVGYYPITSVYGLTAGELALMIADRKWVEEVPELDIIPMLGWKRAMWYDQTGIPWFPPSPNIPDFETAIVYPATVLIEGTNVSEGRGTDRPFRQIGAPWLDGKQLASEMNERALPGVKFNSISFSPRSIPGAAPNPKHMGVTCYGIELIITDRFLFRPVETGIWLLWEIALLGKDNFKIKESGLNRLFGSDALSKSLLGEISPDILVEELRETAGHFDKLRQKYFLYD
ncbi:MAG: hypothetical protein CMG71_07125 [Candidatus Marinimicrobia bacterium]|nr:hypothetical protein [Candidatus Neomarinimicrobiota bacterium]